MVRIYIFIFLQLPILVFSQGFLSKAYWGPSASFEISDLGEYKNLEKNDLVINEKGISPVIGFTSLFYLTKRLSIQNSVDIGYMNLTTGIQIQDTFQNYYLINDIFIIKSGVIFLKIPISLHYDINVSDNLQITPAVQITHRFLFPLNQQ